MNSRNKIPIEFLREEWGQFKGGLAELMNRSDDVNLRNEKIGHIAMHLGLIGPTIQAECNDVVAYFELAADQLSQALIQRLRPKQSEYRGAFTSERFLNVIGAFGNAQAWARCGGLQPWQLRWPEHAINDALGAYLGVLVERLGGRAPTPDSLKAIELACERTQAGRLDRRFLAPAVKGLDAVARGDESAWHLALAQLIAAHAEEAQGGEYRYQPHGLMCLRAMMLARFGMMAGMRCSIESDYLPLNLLKLDM